MTNTVTIGKRIIPLEHLVLVEPFSPSENPDFKSPRDFKSRFVMVDRQSVLAEVEPFAFAEQSGFRMLLEDGIAVNADAIRFSIETFEAAGERFNPTKPYRTRLLWHDKLSGDTHSKLLVTDPQTVLAVVVRGSEAKPGDAPSDSSAPPKQGRRRTRRTVQPAPEPA